MGSTEESSKLNLNKDSEDLKESTKESSKNAKENTSSESCPIPTVASSSGSRPRHDSTSSCDSTRSPSTDRLKRRRTTSVSSSPLSTFFFPPSATGFTPSSSPSGSATFAAPNFTNSAGEPMSLDEVMNARNGVTNMALAHEIAVDTNFKLEKFEPPQESLEKKVRDVMYQAFWDNLREQLEQTPPVYTQAFVLLQEVRDQLLEITLPHQERLKREIKDKLDVGLIKQQAEHGVLNFSDYSGYVVDMMGKLCAPIRDEAIEQLRRETDIVKVFSGVAETMDLMKLDLANYTIQRIRPTIVKQIVSYERDKFKQFLETQQDGLELSRRWILSCFDAELELATQKYSEASNSSTPVQDAPSRLLADPIAQRTFSNAVLNSAYMTLLQWPDQTLMPEAVCVDSGRVLEMRDRFHQLCLLSSILLLTMSTVAQRDIFLDVHNREEAKLALKKDLCPILDPAYTQSETVAALPNLIEAVIVSLNKFLEQRNKQPLEATVVSALRQQLAQLEKSDHHIVKLVTSRGLSFFKELLVNFSPKNTTVPIAFTLLQEELARLVSSFMRFSQHNRAVFGEYYFDMVETKLKSKVASTETTDDEQPGNETKEITEDGSAEKEDKSNTSVVKLKEDKSADSPNEEIRWDSLDLD